MKSGARSLGLLDITLGLPSPQVSTPLGSGSVFVLPLVLTDKIVLPIDFHVAFCQEKPIEIAIHGCEVPLYAKKCS